jgi:hypothetical protein
MAGTGPADARLGRQLVLDEVFDLSLYRALRDIATGSLRGVLDELILIETRHVAFWQEFFGLKYVTRLDPARRLKLVTLFMACRLFGSAVVSKRARNRKRHSQGLTYSRCVSGPLDELSRGRRHCLTPGRPLPCPDRLWPVSSAAGGDSG